MIARRARRECAVLRAESQSAACTGMLPYGVVGEVAARRAVRRVKCLDSSSAILAKSEKKAGGRLGCEGPKRAIMSQLTVSGSECWFGKNVYSREVDSGRCTVRLSLNRTRTRDSRPLFDVR